MLRVGKRVYVCTPDKCFPMEMHTHVLFLHWLPDGLFWPYLRLTGREFWASDYLNLLSVRDVKRLLRDTGCEAYQIRRLRLFGLPMQIIVTAHRS